MNSIAREINKLSNESTERLREIRGDPQETETRRLAAGIVLSASSILGEDGGGQRMSELSVSLKKVTSNGYTHKCECRSDDEDDMAAVLANVWTGFYQFHDLAWMLWLLHEDHQGDGKLKRLAAFAQVLDKVESS